VHVHAHVHARAHAHVTRMRNAHVHAHVRVHAAYRTRVRPPFSLVADYSISWPVAVVTDGGERSGEPLS